jgi:hypothetical protein
MFFLSVGQRSHPRRLKIVLLDRSAGRTYLSAISLSVCNASSTIRSGFSSRTGSEARSRTGVARQCRSVSMHDQAKQNTEASEALVKRQPNPHLGTDMIFPGLTNPKCHTVGSSRAVMLLSIIPLLARNDFSTHVQGGTKMRRPLVHDIG